MQSPNPVQARVRARAPIQHRGLHPPRLRRHPQQLARHLRLLEAARPGELGLRLPAVPVRRRPALPPRAHARGHAPHLHRPVRQQERAGA